MSSGRIRKSFQRRESVTNFVSSRCFFGQTMPAWVLIIMLSGPMRVQARQAI
jgi:hypothetical protein